MNKRALLYSFISIAVLIPLIASGDLFTSADEGKQKNIVALGDSLTYGYGDRTGEGYANGLEEQLNRHRDTPFAVRNHGIRGQQTDGVLTQLSRQKVLQDVEQADTIILFIGTNDFISSNGRDMAYPQRNRLEKGEKEFVKNLDRIFTRLRKQNPDAPILLLGLYDPYPGKVASGPYIEEWNRSSRQVLNRYPRTEFIPTHPLFQDKRKADYFSDSLHPNHRGYELIVGRILKQVDFSGGRARQE